MVAVTQSVHRMPEAGMAPCHKLAFCGQTFQGLPFEWRGIAGDPVQHGGFQHEEAPVDPALISRWLFDETAHVAFVIDFERAITARRRHCRDGRLSAMRFVKGNLCS